ncbi:MAG: redoxin domain-containing protein [Cyanobacteria bacterium P01_A01_bin.123]
MTQAISSDFTGLLTRRFFRNFLPIPAQNRLNPGDRAPDLLLPDVNGQNQLQLSQCWGDRLVVLLFTRIFTEKQYCPLCFPHILAINGAYDQFCDRGVALLMITSTDAQQSQIVVRDLGLKMPLLSDPTCISFRQYGTGQALGAPLPAQFVIDPGGVIRDRHLFSFLHPNASPEQLLQQIP